GGALAELSEQTDRELIHEVEGLARVSGRGGLAGRLTAALRPVEGRGGLQLAADLDDAPEHEVLGAQAAGQLPAALRIEHPLPGGGSGDGPRVNRAQLSSVVELGAQEIDHAVAQVAVLGVAAKRKRENRDRGRRSGSLGEKRAGEK